MGTAGSICVALRRRPTTNDRRDNDRALSASKKLINADPSNAICDQSLIASGPMKTIIKMKLASNTAMGTADIHSGGTAARRGNLLRNLVNLQPIVSYWSYFRVQSYKNSIINILLFATINQYIQI